jgi:hypothetical protein
MDRKRAVAGRMVRRKTLRARQGLVICLLNERQPATLQILVALRCRVSDLDVGRIAALLLSVLDHWAYSVKSQGDEWLSMCTTVPWESCSGPEG